MDAGGKPLPGPGKETGVRRSWLNSYPSGIKPEIDPDGCASVNAMLTRTFREFAGRPAFANLGTVLTYAQVERLSRQFGAYLQSLPDLESGSRVALMMPNILQYPVALFGTLRAGMIAVNVNPLYTARELEHQLTDSGAKVIVILENFAHVLEKVIARTSVKHVVITRLGDLVRAPRRWAVNFAVKHVKKLVPQWHIEGVTEFRAAVNLGAQVPWTEAVPAREDIAVLQYTGGTTGTAKGAILTHWNLSAGVLISRAWVEGLIEEGTEVGVTALPLYHIFSLSTNCLFGVSMGALNVLITNPRDLPGMVKELKNWRFSAISGVNTLYNGLLNTPGFAELDFSRLRYATGGGAAIQRSVAERWRAVTGCPLSEGYGLTECMPASCNPPRAEHSGTVGLPFPSMDVSIRDEHDCEVPVETEGEICLRGPQVMRGYWNRPEETEKALASGWLHTGDIGVIDEKGYLRITDRKKDMIIVSGFKVFPSEVESVISGMPGVRECGVVGVPDPVTGEAVKAFVVRSRDGFSAEDVIAFCREGLTKYKVPKSIEFREELPKNPIGKILRRELRQAPAAGLPARRPAMHA